MTRPSHGFDLSPQRLRHIRWIGGGSGAGKSTVAHLLAEKYGLRLYHCDETQSAHTARSNAADHPITWLLEDAEEASLTGDFPRGTLNSLREVEGTAGLYPITVQRNAFGGRP